MKYFVFFIAFLVLLCQPSSTHAAGLRGLVVEVNSGRALTMINMGKQIKVIVEAAETPEEGQPYSDLARQHLATLVLNKEVGVEYTGLGDGNVLVGRVFLEKMDVGKQMIRDGVAWYDHSYETDLGTESQSYAASEQAARDERRGIWQDPSPVAPWDWRKEQIAKREALAAQRYRSVKPLPSSNHSVSRSARNASSIGAFQKIAPAGEYFSVAMPNNGKALSEEIPTPGGLMNADFYVVAGSDTLYEMLWMTAPYKGEGAFSRMFPNFTEEYNRILKRAYEASGVSCGFASSTDLPTSNGFRGRQYDIPGCQFPGVIRIYYKPQGDKVTVYILAAIRRTSNTAPTKQFLDSFRLSGAENVQDPENAAIYYLGK
jgi:micrococcal nuclease